MSRASAAPSNRSAGAGRFTAGQRVRVLEAHPPGHRRTPAYVRGRVGVVERDCGAFLNPEERAYGFRGEPRRELYRVRFRQVDVWPTYAGPEHDVLDVEIYEHWLEPDETIEEHRP